MTDDLTYQRLQDKFKGLILNLDSSADNNKTTKKTVRSAPPEKKAWTIMVYLGGDNNLAEEMVYALKCMFAAGSTEQVQVYAYYDVGLRPVALKIPTRTTLNGFADDTREFHATVGSNGK